MRVLGFARAGTIAVCLAVVPFGIVVFSDDVTSADQIVVAVETTPLADSPDRSSPTTGTNLAGTAGAFLMLGAGTLGLAHRHRWNSERAEPMGTRQCETRQPA